MLAVQLTADKLVNVWKIIRYQNPTKLLQDIFAATLTELIWSHAASGGGGWGFEQTMVQISSRWGFGIGLPCRLLKKKKAC